MRKNSLDGCFKELVYLKEGTTDITTPIKFLGTSSFVWLQAQRKKTKRERTRADGFWIYLVRVNLTVDGRASSFTRQLLTAIERKWQLPSRGISETSPPPSAGTGGNNYLPFYLLVCLLCGRKGARVCPSYRVFFVVPPHAVQGFCCLQVIYYIFL